MAQSQQADTDVGGWSGLLDFQTGEGVLHGHFSWLIQLMEWVAAIIEIAAIALLIVGALRFIAGVLVAEIARRGPERVRKTNRERIELGRYILAGLELFIVADIIRTALSLAFSDLLFLGLLVVIRSIISYFLDRELKELKSELGS
ncbi:DUF1622 domain-containing protein [Roseitranquillus sediminis]|uniref:DUF1622 domain-containing protein n=1 Tax=Roseitranquillus sediminis TaxID=2809051 RepID=UPI001D0C95D7|nr:DUF1622 domain-containing protein [Roseitranquillus sediminis]MBM9594126.1 DUF1622 domain-containing protein [Roseitranquillus sediminis]